MSNSSIHRAKKSPLPVELPKPQLATATERVPDGDDWVHEIKLDGYRMLCRREGDAVRFVSRNGNDWTAKLTGLAEQVLELELDSLLLDGEVVILGPDGTTDFQALQNAIHTGRPRGLAYFVFDVLHFGEFDIRAATLLDRKAVLAEILANNTSSALRYSDHIRGNGPLVYDNARELNVEGIVSKRCQAPYRPGRSDAWLKAKYQQRREFVIVGFTDSESVDHELGALMLAEAADGEWAYVGRVGTGFTQKTLKSLRETLEGIRIDDCPLPVHPTDVPARDCRWVEPTLVIEVQFLQQTRDGTLRHPSFKGLREDLCPDDLH